MRLTCQNVRLERKIWAKLQCRDPARVHKSTEIKILQTKDSDVVWKPIKPRCVPSVRFRAKSSNTKVHFVRFGVRSA